VKDARAVTEGILDAELIEDKFGNALGGPEVCFPAVSLCAFFEQLDELLSVLIVKFWVRALVSVSVS